MGVKLWRPRSHGRGLIQGNVPPSLKVTASVFYMYVDRDGLASSFSNRTFLFVSFACQCRSSVLRHVLVPQGRSVRIMEAGDKRKLQRQNETQTKDEAK